MSYGGDAIVHEIGAKLEGPRYYVDNGRDCVEGKSGSRVVTVVCRDFSDLQNWHVKTTIEHSPPLLLSARQKWLGEDAAVRRGGVVAIRLGDEAFEKEYLVEAVPEETARRVFEADVRRAFHAAEGKVQIEIKGGRIEVGGGGATYGVADVEVGLALLHLVADRLEAVVAARRASPPSANQVEEEKEQVARLKKLRESFWIRATLIQRAMMVAFLTVMGALAVALFGTFLRFCIGPP